MVTRLRRPLYLTLGLLWLTGCVWLVLQYFFQVVSEFGTAPHPWQPRLMMIHGVLAMVGTFLFGWVAGTHISRNWRHRRRPLTGIALVTFMTLLAITGLGSYYLVAQGLRDGVALVHEATGLLAIAPALAHWLKRPR